MTSPSRIRKATLRERYEHATKFLDGLIPDGPPPIGRRRPHVTLTFAQTVDGCIAGQKGKQLILSGEESMCMTHALRTMHDGILVGVGTVLNDNPRLSARLVPTIPPVHAQPRPIILDSTLRTPTLNRLLNASLDQTGRTPLILTTTPQSDAKVSTYRLAGAQVMTLANLDWSTILETLYWTVGIRRLMVEGGATVIESLLRASTDYVDALIVTVSPQFVGSQMGTRYNSLPVKELNVVRRDWFGDDAVWWWAVERPLPQMQLDSEHSSSSDPPSSPPPVSRATLRPAGYTSCE